uniref:Uncharacterized protein n=1 Tax=Polytomella parva TaxID=51329 RepID=A0A7S0V078_9CHLO|mmetsp:Transcript_24192/g.43312  ORF Transcript_24192/g.43312 Transcript_24192/m.43312 type:complete len:177 (+) Transcript_24192:549-1079(+)
MFDYIFKSPLTKDKTKGKGLLLLGGANSLAGTSSSLGVLTTNAEAPVVAETAVVPDLLEPDEVITESGIDGRGGKLGELAGGVVLLPVKEPVGDLISSGVGNNTHHALKLIGRALTSALPEVNLSLLADDVRETTANTLNSRQGIHNLSLTLNVGVEKTKNVLEIVTLDKRTHFDS